MIDKDKTKQDILDDLNLPPDTEGLWHIRGEDPNCGMGGFHHMPSLEFCEGKLGEVIDYAMTLKGFWQWGRGGSVDPVKIKKINAKANAARFMLEQQKQELEDRLAEINRELE